MFLSIPNIWSGKWHGRVVSIFALSALVHFLVEANYLWKLFKNERTPEKKKLKREFPIVSFITLVIGILGLIGLMYANACTGLVCSVTD